MQIRSQCRIQTIHSKTHCEINPAPRPFHRLPVIFDCRLFTEDVSESFLVSGFAVIRPSEEVGTNLTPTLTPRTIAQSSLSTILPRLMHDRQNHFSLSHSREAGGRRDGRRVQSP